MLPEAHAHMYHDTFYQASRQLALANHSNYHPVRTPTDCLCFKNVYECLACMHALYHQCTWYLQKSEEDIGSLELEVHLQMVVYHLVGVNQT